MQAEMERQEEKTIRESYDRLTAVSHLQIEHFSRHQKLEGYFEYADMGHLFRCDRLLKMENMFARVQMGYNPNRGRSFIFANIKTSRYDTASSRYQREMKEYQMKALLKGENANRGFVAKRQNASSVLIEKAENKPWTESSIRPYLGRVSMEALQKTMPFFAAREEREKLQKVRERRKALREEAASNSRKGEHQENVSLRQEDLKLLRRENAWEAILSRKSMGSLYFLRRLNYAFDFQKHEMFQYYKDQREEAYRRMAEETQGAEPEDEDDET